MNNETFDPMNDVPETVEQCETALRNGYDKFVGDALVSLFQVRMLQGAEMLEAYKDALLAFVKER